MVLRIISDSKEEEVKGGRRKLHNEEHNNLYSWPLLSEVGKAGRECGKHGKKGICVQGFGWKNLQESGRLVDVGAEGKTRQQIQPETSTLIYQVTRRLHRSRLWSSKLLPREHYVSHNRRYLLTLTSEIIFPSTGSFFCSYQTPTSTRCTKLQAAHF